MNAHCAGGGLLSARAYFACTVLPLLQVLALLSTCALGVSLQPNTLLCHKMPGLHACLAQLSPALTSCFLHTCVALTHKGHMMGHDAAQGASCVPAGIPASCTMC